MFVLIDDFCTTTLLFLVPDVAGTVELSLEVEYHILWRLQIEGNHNLAFYTLMWISRNIKGEVIYDFADVGLSVLRKFLGYAFRQRVVIIKKSA